MEKRQGLSPPRDNHRNTHIRILQKREREIERERAMQPRECTLKQSQAMGQCFSFPTSWRKSPEKHESWADHGINVSHSMLWSSSRARRVTCAEWVCDSLF